MGRRATRRRRRQRRDPGGVRQGGSRHRCFGSPTSGGGGKIVCEVVERLDGGDLLQTRFVESELSLSLSQGEGGCVSFLNYSALLGRIVEHKRIPLLTRRGIRSPPRRSQELNIYQFFTHEEPNTNQDIGLDGPSIALRNHFNAAFASAFRR